MKEKQEPKPEVHVSIDGVPLKEFLDEEKNTEIEKHTKHEIAEKKVGIYPTITSKFEGNQSGARSERRDLCKPVYTEEQLAHANYLLHSNINKGEKTMTSSPVLLQPQQLGSIESALNDAKGKEKFYRAEMARNEREATKWSTVASQLEQTLNIVTGKVVVPPGLRITTPRGTWGPMIIEKCKEAPSTQKEIIAFLLMKGAPSPRAAFQAFRQQKIKGTIVEVDGKFTA